MRRRLLAKDRLYGLLQQFPVVAILGSRQVGKTTLANSLTCDHYYDLENPRDLARLENPQLALEDLTGTIVIDEIQKKPNLFPLLRYLVDKNKKQKYLILGSASHDLIRQSSESLAGRIAYFYLGGFSFEEVRPNELNKLWLRGGYPMSFLASSNQASRQWRDNYISTFLERDIPQLGINIPARTLRRFWMMISHYHGQILNYTELARSFGISDMTVRKYIEILEGTFMLRVLQPWHTNLGKRLVKSPKLYIRDSGLFHNLQFIENKKQLMSHIKLGASWEGFALEQVAHAIDLPQEQLFFYSTHTGTEVDLFWKSKGKNWSIEFKFNDAPTLTKSMHIAIEDLQLKKLWVIYPGKERYKLTPKIEVLPLSEVQVPFCYI